MKKIYILFTLVALGVATVAQAFKASDSEKRVTMVRYQFDEASESELSDPNNWTDVTNSTPQNCGPAGDLPCIIEYDSATHGDIAAFLAANPTLEQIEENAEVVSTKQEVSP